MPAVVADTHAIVWYLTNSPRLSPAAAKAFDDASAAGDSILIPSISLVELTYLVEKGRVPAEARKRLVDALAQPGGPYELAPLDGRVAAAVELIDRSVVPGRRKPLHAELPAWRPSTQKGHFFLDLEGQSRSLPNESQS